MRDNMFLSWVRGRLQRHNGSGATDIASGRGGNDRVETNLIDWVPWRLRMIVMDVQHLRRRLWTDLLIIERSREQRISLTEPDYLLIVIGCTHLHTLFESFLV